MKRITIVSALMLALLLVPSAAWSDTPDKETPAPRKPIDVAQLGELLKQLGCNPTPIENAEGTVIGYEGKYISKQLNGWMDIKAVLSTDGSTVWLKVPLDKVTDLEGVPNAVFVKLLAANRRTAPAFFGYVDDESRIYLFYPTYAAGMNVTTLEQQLDYLLGVVRKTSDVWETKGWPKETPAPKAK